MNAGSFNSNSILRHYLPSVFFIALFTIAVFQSEVIIGSIVAAAVPLILLANLFVQNKIVSRVLGIIFLLVSAYFLLALSDDIIDGEAAFFGGYWVGFVLFASGLVMSVLLIVNYKRRKTTF